MGGLDGKALVSTLLRRTLYTVAAGIVLYVAGVVWLDARPVADTLVGYPWWVFGVALLASATNYLLRFAKWELSLGWLRVRETAPGLTRSRSLVVYLAGLSMSITPGKVGEVLRSMLLKASDGVPFTRTAPIVVADRLTDLIALVLLSLVGLVDHEEYTPYVLVTTAFVAAGIIVLGSPRLLGGVLDLLGRLPKVDRVVARARPLVDSSATLLRPGPLLWLTALSVVGWGLECVGFWLILDAFAGVSASLSQCAFLWAMGTLVGAISLLPGGLVATEGSLVLATTHFIAGATQAVAVAASLLGRIATLWFGEVVGGVALAIFLRDPALREKAMGVQRDR